MFAAPAVAGDVVFIGSCGGSFYALDRHTGKPLWSYDTHRDGPPANFHGDPVVTDQLVVVGTDTEPEGLLYAFDRQTGEVRWKRPAPSGFFATVLRHGQNILALTTLGDAISYAIEDGRTAWTFDKAPHNPHGTNTPSPALAGDRFILPSPGGQLFALDASSGRVVWQRDLAAEIHTSVTVTGEVLYVGDRSGRVHKLNAASGAVEATLETGGTPFGTMVAAEGCLLAQWTPGIFACIDPALTDVRWRKTATDNWSSFKSLVWNGTVFTGTESGRVSQFRLLDGAELWSQSVKGPIKGLAIASDGTLYVGTQFGMIYALSLPSPEAPHAGP
ncbi:MAG TPA: PQQ-binding-like beta-propeller repeat protein [Thermoanaerobaculia bacterium]|nr:PQQ-binding-like beta-propeller repeat protein [Thermoanaerobaculia bacterium]